MDQQGSIGNQRWLGSLRGSRAGTLYLENRGDGQSLLVIGFAGGGDVRLSAIDNESNGTIDLLVEDTNEQFGVAKIEWQSDDKATGSWQFATGATGVFDLVRYADAAATGPEVITNLPDQVLNREVPIGAVTLYRPDLERLIAEMESLVPKPNITTIRATENGQIVVQPASKYLERKDYVDVVRVLTVSTAEVSDKPIKRIANVMLDDDGSSQILISSPDEIWTEAAASRLSKFLDQFSSKLTGWLRRQGLNINTIILFAILIWIPDRPLFERIIVFGLGVLLIAMIAKSHSMLPYNRVYLDPERQKRPFAKEMPGAALAAVAGLVTSALSIAPDVFDKVGKWIAMMRTWLN